MPVSRWSFEFGWDKSRDHGRRARRDGARQKQKFPEGPTRNIRSQRSNFSEFPTIIAQPDRAPCPKRTNGPRRARITSRLRWEGRRIAVLEAGLAGDRDEMFEVLIDPLRAGGL